MKELKDNELDAVNGGDYDDRDKEQSETPDGVKFLYNIGDHVEVYLCGIHSHTKGGTIVERTLTTRRPGCTTYYLGNYKVEFDEGGERWVDVSSIESK